MSNYNVLPHKRILKEGNHVDPNKKQRISLSLRKTRQKKQVNIPSQEDQNLKSDVVLYKRELKDLPFELTCSIKEEEQHQNDGPVRTKLLNLPDFTCSLKQKDAIHCIKLKDLDEDKLTSPDHSFNFDIPSSQVPPVKEFAEIDASKLTHTNSIKYEYHDSHIKEHDCTIKYIKKEDASSSNIFKYETKAECSGLFTVEFEANEETIHGTALKNEYDNKNTVKYEEYDCPICNINLTYITCTEFRQKHVEDCISSAQYVEQVFDGCVVCNQELSYLDLNQRQKHINRCLDGSAATRHNCSDEDFATPKVVFRTNQKLPKPTRADDKHDELYQATLAMSKSLLQKADKKVKIEMNEANIWSNQESQRAASQNLCRLLKTTNEVMTSRQSEREVSVGYLHSSSVRTLPTLLPCHSLPVNFWEMAGLQKVNPLLFTCSFLRNNHASSKKEL